MLGLGTAAAEGTCKLRTPLKSLFVMSLDMGTPGETATFLPQSHCFHMKGSPDCRVLPFDHSHDYVALYAEPGGGGDPVSYLVLHYKGNDWTISYLKGWSSTPVTVEPDDVLGMAAVQQTLLERRGDWYRIALPAPLLGSGWVRGRGKADDLVSDLTTSRNPGPLVLELGDRSVVIVSIKGDLVTLRDEQPEADDFMKDSRPALAPFETFSLHMKDLYDEGCRLKIKIKYKMGC